MLDRRDAERTNVRFAASSKNLPVNRTEPAQPVRVVPSPRTFRPSVSLKMRSRSTWVWKKIDRATTATSRTSLA